MNEIAFMRRKQLRQCADLGMSRREAAEHLNISRGTVDNYARRFEIDFPVKVFYRPTPGSGTRNYGVKRYPSRMKRIMVPFPDAVAEQIQELAAEAKTSFAEQVRCLVANALQVNPRKRVEVEA